MTFAELLRRKRGNDFKVPYVLLSFDPGHTTGWAVFIDGTLAETGESVTVNADEEFVWENLLELFNIFSPTHIVCEDYKPYLKKKDQHIGNKILTLRLIGAITLLCWMRDIPLYFQMAATAKSFWTNDKLAKLGIKPTSRHAMDAVRHGCHLLVFNKEVL